MNLRNQIEELKSRAEELKSRVEELKSRAAKDAEETAARAVRLSAFLDALEQAYPTLAGRLDKLPFEACRGIVWVTAKQVETLAEGIALLQSLEQAPCKLTKISRGCCSFEANIPDDLFDLKTMEDAGCVLLHHERAYTRSMLTVMTLEVYLPLEGYPPFRLQIEIKDLGKQIENTYREEGRRNVLVGYQLPSTFNGDRIKWASGGIEYANKFTEYFPGCENLDDLIECYPQLIQ